MRIHLDPRPGTVRQPVPRPRAAAEPAADAPPAPPDAPPAEQPTPAADARMRSWLIALGVFVTVAVAFTAMVVLTMLAGGDGYLR
ncbi:hypothetical protein [Blastococcus xanthinilyticus]|uniref:Uncharacterized protein n=1 Tax=Blastococcus xanthinilyticus TaxID=1564164 RepID=A0A5S5CT01_9ACTN|nr:hypothetical protein [Blastococcus xanthinilyticus]TYP86880.1 hypothetical protein BD833_108165 [Blastococcus xanthinilyticus]